MREVRGARREPPLYSFARCFVTRCRGSWTIAMGITKKKRIVAAAPPRAAAAVWSLAWLSLPIWHRRMPVLPKTG